MHPIWVRLCHWSIAAVVLALLFSGSVILMAHPRLYWGETGNDMTAAWIELPISRNYKHGGYTAPQRFEHVAGQAVTAERTYDIFNQNGWGRSLHFLAAWLLAAIGLIYGAVALASGHLRRNLLPGREGIRPAAILADIRTHVGSAEPAPPGPPYNLLQRWAYCLVLLLCLPLMVLSGLTMAPAITASFPWLLDMFGGSQSARSIHFLAFAAILLFLLVHVAMVFRTGFWRQIKAMTLGR